MKRFRPQVFLDFQSLGSHAFVLVASCHPATQPGVHGRGELPFLQGSVQGRCKGVHISLNGFHASVQNRTLRDPPNRGQMLIGQRREHEHPALLERLFEPFLKAISPSMLGLVFQAQTLLEVGVFFKLLLFRARGEFSQRIGYKGLPGL